MAVKSAAFEDVRVLEIPWRKVLAGAATLAFVVAAWFVTTNTYAVVWQQHLDGRWRATVAAGAPVAHPAPGQPVAMLSIPSIGFERVVLEGDDGATLRKAPGHVPDTPLPGETGNSVIQGHRLLWSAPFSKLEALGFGAPVFVQAADGTVLRFLVAGIFHPDPGDPTIFTNESSLPMVSLVTSDPPLRADRLLVVQAVLPASEAPGGNP